MFSQKTICYKLFIIIFKNDTVVKANYTICNDDFFYKLDINSNQFGDLTF